MKPLKILILEDNVIVAKDLSNVLKKYGNHEPSVFRKLEDALEAVHREDFDLAIVDIVLENGDSGITLAKEINARSLMPFVYLTAHYKDENFELARQTKPAAYLIKPFKEKELAFQVQLAYESFHAALSSSPDNNAIIFLPTHKGLKKIDKRDVALLEANKSSTYIYLKNLALPELFSVNLGYLSQFFKAPDFYMVSRSAMVNLNYIEEIEFNEIKLSNISRKIRISESKKSEFLKSLFIVRRPK